MQNNDIREGLKDGAVAAFSSAPFGLLFGALAADNGLSLFEAGLMSATIFAGASQIVGIEMFGHDIPAWVVVLSVFAVNFRHILYSAAIAPFIRHYSLPQKTIAFFLLVDPQFAETSNRADRGASASFTWYLSMALPIYVAWILATLLGAYFGKMIGDPHAMGFDVLPAMYFLGMVVSFRSRRNFYPVVAASALTSVAALHLVGSPWHVSIGALVGVAVAAFLAPSARQAVPAAGEPE